MERAWASPAGAAQLGPRALFHVRPQLLTLMQPRGARSAERGLVRKGAAQPGPEPGEGGATAASPLAC